MNEVEPRRGRLYGEFHRPGMDDDWVESEREELIPVELPIEEIIELAKRGGRYVSSWDDSDRPTRIIAISGVEERANVSRGVLEVMIANEADGRESVWVRSENIDLLYDVCQGVPNEHLDSIHDSFFKLVRVQNPHVRGSRIRNLINRFFHKS